MKKSLHKLFFYLINASPFFKRIFYFDPSIYGVLTVVPLLALFPLSISVGRLIITICVVIFSLTIYFIKGWFDFVLLAPFILAISFRYFQSLNFNDFQRAFIPLFLVVVAYALYQKVFGYTFFEMGWIFSGLGTVVAEGYFIRSDVRPFSLLAGTPELAFFLCAFAFFFFNSKRWLLLAIAIAMVLVVGSRGVIVAAFVATLVMFLNRYMRFGYRLSLFAAIGMSFLVYIFLIYIYPSFVAPFITSMFSDSRMAVYGTFNARLVHLIELIGNIDSYFTGSIVKVPVADNFFLYLVYNYGVFSLPIFFGFIFYYTNSRKNLFLSALVVSYMFYADVFLSYFMTYNYCVWMFLNEKSTHRI